MRPSGPAIDLSREQVSCPCFRTPWCPQRCRCPRESTSSRSVSFHRVQLPLPGFSGAPFGMRHDTHGMCNFGLLGLDECVRVQQGVELRQAARRRRGAHAESTRKRASTVLGSWHEVTCWSCSQKSACWKCLLSRAGVNVKVNVNNLQAISIEDFDNSG